MFLMKEKQKGMAAVPLLRGVLFSHTHIVRLPFHNLNCKLNSRKKNLAN